MRKPKFVTIEWIDPGSEASGTSTNSAPWTKQEFFTGSMRANDPRNGSVVAYAEREQSALVFSEAEGFRFRRGLLVGLGLLGGTLRRAGFPALVRVELRLD